MLDYAKRHNAAILNPREGFESALKAMLSGWNEYAATYFDEWGTPIGDDYVVGPAWRDVGRALLTMLNGETGRFDCGTLDAFIRKQMVAVGFDPDNC